MLHLLLAAALNNPGTRACTTRRIEVRESHVVELRKDGHLVSERVVYERTKTVRICAIEQASSEPDAQVAPSGDRWPNIDFGVYGNTFYDDCTLAAVADLEQIYKEADAPLVAPADDSSPTADPFVAEYLSLSGGSSTTGLAVTSALNAWEQAPIDGVQIASYQPVSIDPQTIEDELTAGTPLFAWFSLPARDAAGDAVATAPWTTRATPAGAPTDGTHVGVIVGATADYVDIAMWGHVQQVSWKWWSTWALGAWSVSPN